MVQGAELPRQVPWWSPASGSEQFLVNRRDDRQGLNGDWSAQVQGFVDQIYPKAIRATPSVSVPDLSSYPFPVSAPEVSPKSSGRRNRLVTHVPFALA